MAAASIPIGILFDNTSYWTNIISSITGAGVGVPVAVLVLVEVYDSRNTATERKRVRALASRAAEDLRDAVESCLPHGFDVEQFAQVHIDLTNCIQSRLAVWLVRSEHKAISPDDWPEIRSMFAELLRCLETVDKAQFPEWREGWWDEVETAWDYLDQVVRPRVYQAEEPWLPVRLRSLLRRAVTFGDPLLFQRDVVFGLANAILRLRRLAGSDGNVSVNEYGRMIESAAEILYREGEPWGDKEYRVFQLYLLRPAQIAAKQLSALMEGPESMELAIAETLPEYANVP